MPETKAAPAGVGAPSEGQNSNPSHEVDLIIDRTRDRGQGPRYGGRLGREALDLGRVRVLPHRASRAYAHQLAVADRMDAAREARLCRIIGLLSSHPLGKHLICPVCHEAIPRSGVDFNGQATCWETCGWSGHVSECGVG